MSRRALVIGEALIDIVERDGVRQEFVGGSPANVALGIARLEHPSRLLTQLGHDDRGARIASALEPDGVEIDEVSYSAPRTSTALARIDSSGAAEYEFDIDWALESVPVGADDALIHIGSIALFLEPGGARILSMLEELAQEDRLPVVTLDPNIRASLLGDHASSVSRFERAATYANVIKLSDEDAAWLYPGVELSKVAEHLLALADRGLRIIVITRGAAGSVGFTRQTSVAVSAVASEVVDTISAGDSFMASLAASVLDHGLDSVHADLLRVLERASRAAGFAVSRAGANLPRRTDIDRV